MARRLLQSFLLMIQIANLPMRSIALYAADDWNTDRRCGRMTDDYDDDYCWECSGYGDDYFVNDEGELECYCPYCSQSGYADDY